MRHSAAAALSLALFALSRPARAAAAEKPFDAKAAADELWKERLDFTDAQTTKYEAAKRARDESSAALRAQMRADYRKLRSQIAAKSKEDELLATLKQLARLKKALRDEDDKFDAAIASFLTPIQRAKVAAGDSTDGASAASGVSPSDMRDILTDGDGEPE
jgi:Spy/CpxP family protein refolding chaperone